MTYYYDYIDRMTKYATIAVEWDTWGNMTKLSTHTYASDDVDRLTKFDHATRTSNDATYGCFPGTWQRYKRVQDTTVEYYVYDGANVLASYDSDKNLTARFVTPGLDDNLSVTRAGNTYYYAADGLGSIRNVLDSSEVAQNTYDYYAFGDVLGTQTEGVTNPYRFTARDYESGGILSTHYYRNRYYMPCIGIFASRDAMWADMHRGWVYVGNVPTMLFDPYGTGVRDFVEKYWFEPMENAGSWLYYNSPVRGVNVGWGMSTPDGSAGFRFKGGWNMDHGWNAGGSGFVGVPYFGPGASIGGGYSEDDGWAPAAGWRIPIPDGGAVTFPLDGGVNVDIPIPNPWVPGVTGGVNIGPTGAEQDAENNLPSPRPSGCPDSPAGSPAGPQPPQPGGSEGPAPWL